MTELLHSNASHAGRILVPQLESQASLDSDQASSPIARFNPIVALLLFFTCALSPSSLAQTANTGALTGTITDPSGAVIANANVTVTNEATGDVRTVTSENQGNFSAPLLPPGSYRAEASKAGFKVSTVPNIRINVTETQKLNIHLALGDVSEKVTVVAEGEQLQTESSALGRVTTGEVVNSLPLVTRNYTQILGLSSGVSGEVTNAANIGRGDTSASGLASGYSVHGSGTTDNNFQMNGSQVNDLMGSGNFSGGVPVPNPDSIQEFKVQTGQYDASYGRNAGANVNVITKSGTNEYHGNLWEYFRNTALNANDYFLNAAGKPRGVLNQNQFGLTLGGPIKRGKLFFFGSYQGTRQRNGLGAACLSTGNLPVGLTADAGSRTAAALASEFNGQSGILGGTITSAADITPTALAVLNAQLSGGQFLIPAPPSGSATGQTTFSSPCKYDENQFVSNVDYDQSSKSHFSAKFFFLNSEQLGTLPPVTLGLATLSVPGFGQANNQGFRDFALTHTYVVNNHLVNQAVLGFHRLSLLLDQKYPNVDFATQACATSTAGPVSLSNVCVPAPSFDDPFPSINVGGFFSIGGNGQGDFTAQNYYNLNDTITYVRGKHSLYFGGGIDRSQINFENFHFLAGLFYPSFPDFLLGNVLFSVDLPGLFNREWRTWDGNLYVQDNYRVTSRLTLNLGLRYARQGQLGEELGRASTFNLAAANPNPPAAGTLDGYVVASNFSGGTIPAGVAKASTNTALNNDGQNAWEPRLGFAWRLPATERMVLRGGYGVYHTRTVGQSFLQLITAPPFGTIRVFILPSSVSTALPPSSPFPFFAPYSPTTSLTPTIFALDFRPPTFQQYSMNLQTGLSHNFVLEVGYQGSRGTHLVQVRNFNQALSASPANPIRGETTNTVDNVPLRVPIEGFAPSGAGIIESAGSSWYNALAVSLNRRFGKGFYLQAAYTLTSALETSPGYVTALTGSGGGALIGNQTAASNYGFDPFIRPQRLIVSYVYQLPGPKNPFSLAGRALRGWSLSGVTTLQSGARLTLTNTNTLNAFGILGDLVQIAPGCTNSSLATSGLVTRRLNGYFNNSCFAVPPVIGADGLATGFGNGGFGTVSGPDQRVFDIAFVKRTPLGHSETKNIEFRAELFNAFNTPSFANPNTNAGTIAPGSTGTPELTLDPTFGTIQGTSVNPRIVQFALKFNF